MVNKVDAVMGIELASPEFQAGMLTTTLRHPSDYKIALSHSNNEQSLRRWKEGFEVKPA